MDRNRAILLDIDSGLSFKEVAFRYGLTAERIRQIYREDPRSFSEADHTLIREMVTRYGLLGLLREVTRIIDNYANTSEKWKRVATIFRITLTRELR